MDNPLVPAPFDLFVSAVAVAVWVFAALAFISAIRARHVTGLRFLAWAILIVFVPVAGAAAWFVWGRGREGEQSDAEGRAAHSSSDVRFLGAGRGGGSGSMSG